jgi:hypothetical protein
LPLRMAQPATLDSFRGFAPFRIINLEERAVLQEH